MSDRKYLSGNEASDIGVVQEVNRQLLHARGLALQVDYLDEGSTVEGEWLKDIGPVLSKHVAGLSDEDVAAIVEDIRQAAPLGIQIWDDRDDPEGIFFALGDSEAATPADRVEEASRKAVSFDDLLRKRDERQGKYGFDSPAQPIWTMGWDPGPGGDFDRAEAEAARMRGESILREDEG
jgi:hypothetical protein